MHTPIKMMFPEQKTIKWKFKCFIARNIPHKTVSGNHWCLPIWYIKIFGGNGDTGNGYCWHPSKFNDFVARNPTCFSGWDELTQFRK